MRPSIQGTRPGASMIVGDGMLARAFAGRFAQRDDVLVFASGVSNSQETDPAHFAREAALLDSALLGHGGPVLYFGSCNIADADRAATPYARHKREMEARVLRHPRGLVLRLPQVVGVTANPNTLTNYMRDRILADERFTVWENAERNLIDVEDVASIAAELLAQDPELPRALSIASAESLPMPALVSIFERVLGRPARFRIEPRGAPLRIEAGECHAIARSIGLDLGTGYAERVIRKYYGS